MKFIEFGKTIKKYRVLKKISQTELGNLLFMDQSQISRLENSPTHVNPSDFPKIAKALTIDEDILERAYNKDIKHNFKNKDLIIFDINKELNKIFDLLEKEDIITEKNKWNENIEKTNEKIIFIKKIINILKNPEHIIKELHVEKIIYKLIKTSQKFYENNEDLDFSKNKTSEFMISFKLYNDEFILLEYLLKKELDKETKEIIDFVRILAYSNFLENSILIYNKEILEQSTNKEFKNIINFPLFLLNDNDFSLKEISLEDFKNYIAIIYAIKFINNKHVDYISAINKNELFYIFFNDLLEINLENYTIKDISNNLNKRINEDTFENLKILKTKIKKLPI